MGARRRALSSLPASLPYIAWAGHAVGSRTATCRLQNTGAIRAMRRAPHPEPCDRGSHARAQARLVSEVVRSSSPATRSVWRARAQPSDQGGAISAAFRHTKLSRCHRDLPEIRDLPVAADLRRRLADALSLWIGTR